MADLLVPQAQPISSYDYFDLAAGTGVQIYYGGKVMFISGAELVSGMVLRNKTFYSESLTSKATVASTTFGRRLNTSFDLDFNNSRTINGNIIVSIPIGMNALANVDKKHVYTDIYFYRVDTAGVETFLVSGGTMIFSPTNLDGDEAYSRISTASFDVDNQKFKKDEKLRMRVEVWSRGDAAGSYLVGIAHDPINRNDNNEGLANVTGSSGPIIQDTDEGVPKNRWATDTVMRVDIPFKLDVEV